MTEQIKRKFAHALKGGVNQTALLSAGHNQRCTNCGKALNNATDPSSSQVGTKCRSCAEEDAQERKAS